jgi:hypothetical protein
MDELFGEVGFAQDDLERKARIEREIGLTALLNGEAVDGGESSALKSIHEVGGDGIAGQESGEKTTASS